MQMHAFYGFIFINMMINECYHGLKMTKMIIFMFKRIFLIFHDLITTYEKFMTLIYEENDLLRHKTKFLFLNMYLQKKIMNI